MKTICIVNGLYFPHTGGVESYIHNLAIQLNKLGYRIIILTSNTEKVKEIEHLEHFTVYRLPVINLVDKRFPVIIPSKKTFDLIKKIKSENIDFFLIQMRFYATSILGAVLSKQLQKPAVVVEHVTGYMTINNKIFNYLGKIYENWVTRFMEKRVNAFYAISKACANWLKNFNIESQGIFYNGVVLDSLNIDESNALIPKSNDEITFTFAGRLIESKGIKLLVEVFTDLQKKYNNIKLIICGTGELYNELKEKTAGYSNILMTWQIAHREAMKFLKNSDIVVIPSNYPEGLPTLILEAGACSAAVIATNVGGTNEVISNEELGILIEPNNLQQLKDAMEKLIINKDLREKLAKNLNKKIILDFLWENNAKVVASEIEKQFSFVK
ncbi:MAG TPA: glycosyltransferase family 4 protein [Candidatus Kapabacteria bacterium]|nr:glycosyltransferase family 4 protein [Candidatus Kapabacteria bacterium]HPO63601.1 glycosyltransferase family 4 protein [Candidatus Kapabacteria bacterium]